MSLAFYNWSKVLLYSKELKEESVVLIDLHPSDICNFSCVWCRYDRTPNQLSWDQLISILEKFPTIRSVAIGGGGEPLTNRHVPSFIRECGKRGIVTGMYTNGSLIDENSIDALSKNSRFCRISLDAGRKQTHALLHRCHTSEFDRILKNIRKLKEKGISELGLSYLVVPENVDEIPLLTDLNLPIDYVHFKPLIQGIDDKTRKKGIQNAKKLQERADFTVKSDRLEQDLMCNHDVPCKITKIIRVVAADRKEYACCEHDQESKFEIGKWDGSNRDCVTCRYNGYNEVIHAYDTNKMAKELL